MTPVIVTASPALRSRTMSSVRGVVIFLAAMIPPSEFHGLVPLGVALHVHGHRHAGDVARHLLDEHVESRGRAAEALRPDAERVDLGEHRDHVDGAAYADADDHRRARVGAGPADRVDDRLDHAVPSLRGLEHVEAAHVLGAAALGHHREPYLVAGDDAGVQDGRRVVLGVATGVRGLFGDRLAQVAVAVALPHALVDGVVERAADEVHVLPHLGEDHREARVLADGHAVGGGDVGVLDELAEDLLADRALLGLPGLHEGVVDVFGQIVVGRDAHRLRGLRDLADVEFAYGHGDPLQSFLRSVAFLMASATLSAAVWAASAAFWAAGPIASTALSTASPAYSPAPRAAAFMAALVGAGALLPSGIVM